MADAQTCITGIQKIQFREQDKCSKQADQGPCYPKCGPQTWAGLQTFKCLCPARTGIRNKC